MDAIDVDGLTVAYSVTGTGPPVVLLHGWPTSSYLWRRVTPAIAIRNRVIAVDLPGFGRSSKPPTGYGFPLYHRVLDGVLDTLGLDQVALVGHDIGGPIALHWALHRPSRVTRIALLNTLVYPQFAPSVLEFVRACLDPARRAALTSPVGLAEVMRLGVSDAGVLTDDVLDAVAAPFGDEPARLALAAAGAGLSARGFVEIERALPQLSVPVRVVYGEQDRVLPDIADTVARLRGDLPHAEVTALPGCGHFLQEEAPAQVGALLAAFLAADAEARR